MRKGAADRPNNHKTRDSGLSTRRDVLPIITHCISVTDTCCIRKSQFVPGPKSPRWPGEEGGKEKQGCFCPEFSAVRRKVLNYCNDCFCLLRDLRDQLSSTYLLNIHIPICMKPQGYVVLWNFKTFHKTQRGNGEFINNYYDTALLG